MNKIFIPIPHKIPISNCNNKHAMNVPKPGIKSDSIKYNIIYIKTRINVSKKLKNIFFKF